MSKKSNKKTKGGVENVDRALSTAEQFIEENQKTISVAVVVVLALITAVIGIKRYYLNPLEEEARTEMFRAEQYFESDSFNLALNGDDNYLGFVDIIDGYGLTKSANLAKYYAGISNLQLGNFEDAISYLESFKRKGELSTMALGAIGDAYSELGDYDEALNYYEKAVSQESNKITTPMYLMKAGLVCEELEDYDKAFEFYSRIKREFEDSDQGRQIDKYLARTEILK